jgi:hypothetical protein
MYAFYMHRIAAMIVLLRNKMLTVCETVVGRLAFLQETSGEWWDAKWGDNGGVVRWAKRKFWTHER